MKNIIVIGASTSKNSINKRFANYTASQLNGAKLLNIDISKYMNLPIFSVDVEKSNGAPKEILDLKSQFNSADGFIISFAEHNGSYAAGYKNVLDWISREEGKIFNGKPTLLLSTSPGARGGATVLGTALAGYPHLGAKVTGSFSLPSFNDNFIGDDLMNEELKNELFSYIYNFQNSL